MKNRKLKITMLAALGFLGAGAIEAQAADITVIDQTSQLIHPYFRSPSMPSARIPSCASPSRWTARRRPPATA